METMRARMKSRFVEYVNDNEGQKITPDDIIWCGIMDWGREPYGAASHAWRPTGNTGKLSPNSPNGRSKTTTAPRCIHVCGEAYSDYHAFIEGALRSALHVLTKIPKKSGQTKPNEGVRHPPRPARSTLSQKAIKDAIDADEAEDAAAAKKKRRTTPPAMFRGSNSSVMTSTSKTSSTGQPSSTNRGPTPLSQDLAEQAEVRRLASVLAPCSRPKRRNQRARAVRNGQACFESSGGPAANLGHVRCTPKNSLRHTSASAKQLPSRSNMGPTTRAGDQDPAATTVTWSNRRPPQSSSIPRRSVKTSAKC